MDDSILTSIKKLLGIASDDTSFDVDIIADINSVFTILYQLGVGQSPCFSISDDTAIWSDFLANDTQLQSVKTYMALKVRTIFDPPQSSSVLQANNEIIKELEWRLNVTVDPDSEQIYG